MLARRVLTELKLWLTSFFPFYPLPLPPLPLSHPTNSCVKNLFDNLKIYIFWSSTQLYHNYQDSIFCVSSPPLPFLYSSLFFLLSLSSHMLRFYVFPFFLFFSSLYWYYLSLVGLNKIWSWLGINNESVKNRWILVSKALIFYEINNINGSNNAEVEKVRPSQLYMLRTLHIPCIRRALSRLYSSTSDPLKYDGGHAPTYAKISYSRPL